MTALVLALALTAGPPRVALMTGSRVGVGEKEAAQLSARLGAQLKTAGLAVLEVNLPCAGDLACLQTQGRDVGVEAVVSITLAAGPRQIAVDVETVLVASGVSIDQRSLSWKNKQNLDALEPLLRECAGAIARTVLAQRLPDAPVKVVLAPELPATPHPELVGPGAPRVSRAPELIVGGGAVALGIVAAVLAGIAAGQQQQLAAAEPFSLTRAEATAQRDAANGTYTAAAITGGAGGALAITTLALFVVR